MNEQRKTELGDVILEFIALGNSVKVSAIHVATGEEVSIVGPTNAAQEDLEKTAVAKLKYVLDKKAGDKKGPGVVV